MVTVETSIESLAAQLQNETLKEILARDTGDRPALTFWAHVRSHHGIVTQRPRSKGLSGTLSRYDTMPGPLPLP
jgi:hypothetical protein